MIQKFRAEVRKRLVDSGQCSSELLSYLEETVELEVEKRVANYAANLEEKFTEAMDEIKEIRRRLNKL